MGATLSLRVASMSNDIGSMQAERFIGEAYIAPKVMHPCFVFHVHPVPAPSIPPFTHARRTPLIPGCQAYLAADEWHATARTERLVGWPAGNNRAANEASETVHSSWNRIHFVPTFDLGARSLDCLSDCASVCQKAADQTRPDRPKRLLPAGSQIPDRRFV
jgi:hypothetical protein